MSAHTPKEDELARENWLQVPLADIFFIIKFYLRKRAGTVLWKLFKATITLTEFYNQEYVDTIIECDTTLKKLMPFKSKWFCGSSFPSLLVRCIKSKDTIRLDSDTLDDLLRRAISKNNKPWSDKL